MKSRAEIRLNCLHMASTLANTKVISPAHVILQAQQYLDWIEERHKDRGDEDPFYPPVPTK